MNRNLYICATTYSALRNMRRITKEITIMIKTNRIPDMGTYTTWMLIIVAVAILAICGGMIGSWALIIASSACLLICVAKVLKFYISSPELPRGG